MNMNKKIINIIIDISLIAVTFAVTDQLSLKVVTAESIWFDVGIYVVLYGIAFGAKSGVIYLLKRSEKTLEEKRMSDYTWRELIKQNIAHFFSKMKIRREKNKSCRRDWLEGNLPIENKEYMDLSPKSDIKNGDEYVNTLHWALKNDNVKNIALTEPYGSGKSSIIQSYLKRHPSTKALNISLATFDLKEEDEDFENQIELGILKQLFYKVDSDLLPQSRYTKIKKKSFYGYMVKTGIFVVLILLAYAFFEPESFAKMIERIVEIGEIHEIPKALAYGITIAFAVVGTVSVAWLIRWATSKFHLKEVSVADTATVANEKDESSIFDKSMDEIVYFFEATDYCVVFIEDLDRFKSSEIFTKLRELNTILNNYDLIKRRITFVYAIKDDMFKNEERTKFFDFIIPVIPIVNSTNSGEILREKLQVTRQVNGQMKSSLYNISSGYITLIAPFIEDMRVLTNVCNEFVVYRKNLNNVKLNDEELFSLMLFKSLYPLEFAELEAEKGIVKKAFENKKAFILQMKQGLENQKKEGERILDNIEQDVLKDIVEVKAAFLNYIAGPNGAFNYCNISGLNYYYKDVMSDSFDMNRFVVGRFTVWTHGSTSRTINANGLDPKIKAYLDRLENLKHNTDERRQEIQEAIEKCLQKIYEIHSYSMARLMELYDSSEILSEEVRENKFLVFLLRKGFINENYADYINYFHPNSITKEEMYFVRGIRMQESVGDFSYPIRNVEQVCERIESYEFKQKEVLNYDIVDYLLTKALNSERCHEFFNGLSKGEGISEDFVRAYIERGNNISVFVNRLCNVDSSFWYRIKGDKNLSEEKQFQYLALILQYADIESIVDLNYYGTDDATGIQQDALIKTFIENNKYALNKLSKVSSDKMILVIQKLNVCFNDFDVFGVNDEVLDYIFDNNCYEINLTTISCLVRFKAPDKAEQLEKSQYSVICSIDYKPLNNRLSDLDVFKNYVEKIVLGYETNTEEKIENVETIIERLFDSEPEMCKRVLAKQNVTWDSLKMCCCCPEEKSVQKEIIWNHVLELSKVHVSWTVFMDYYEEYGLKNPLIAWLDRTMNVLVEENKPDELDDEILQEVLKSDISVESFQLLVRNYDVEEFNCSLELFDKERIQILIDNHYLPFSKEYLDELYKMAPNLVVSYLLIRRDELLQEIPDIELQTTTISSLIRSGIFVEEEIKKLLACCLPENITHDIAMDIRDLQFEVDKALLNKAWEILSETERYQLLLNQLRVYSIEEISNKLATLDYEYQKLADVSKRHREYLSMDDFGYNEKLLIKLKEKDYITSYKINESVHEEPVTFKKITKRKFEVWVKRHM